MCPKEFKDECEASVQVINMLGSQTVIDPVTGESVTANPENELYHVSQVWSGATNSLQ
jgi:hypothetical protein